ncbi:MAG: type IX secretion system sortase PorU, partial [Bacteroidales bacterium]|nr:type IX secretion system sortase PorU [Bacteroidales bacterium]
FKGANYKSDNLLPYYYELINVSGENYSAKITNIRYSVIKTKNIKIDRNSIPKKLSSTVITNYIRQKPYLQISFLPLRINPVNGNVEKVTSFDIEMFKKPTTSGIKNISPKYLNESVLKNGNWIKIKVQENGIYKYTYSELLSMGVASPEDVKIYGNASGMLPFSNISVLDMDLVQNPVFFEKGSDGVFNQGDYILFYGQCPDIWEYNESEDFYNLSTHNYSNSSYYFLTSDVGNILEIGALSEPIEPETKIVSSFTDLVHYEKNDFNLLKSGSQWFGENFDIATEKEFNFSLPNIVSSKSVKIKYQVAARSPGESSFSLFANGQSLSTITIPAVNMSNQTYTFAFDDNKISSFYSSSSNISVLLKYNKYSASSEGWLDYITINAIRNLSISSDQFIFSYKEDNTDENVSKFIISNSVSDTKLWDISDPTNARLIVGNRNPGKGSISFKTNTNSTLRRFIAFNKNNFLKPEVVGQIDNQNLHSFNHQDMIIITNPDFLNQANQIADIHRNADNLKVLVVTNEQVYNEFSSGSRDAAAIRNFTKMIYNRPTANDTLKYLLLLGDGSYDNKNENSSNTNYIVTYQSENSLVPTKSFITDDFFGLLDSTDDIEASNSGLVDIGIGRLPVNSVTQAQALVNKISNYLNSDNKGNWLNSICFIGDDEDSNVHMYDSDKLAEFVDSTYQYFYIDKFYLDAYPQESSVVGESYPEVNRLINDEVNNGVFIFNYTGHGGEDKLAHENIVSVNDINSWKNKDKLAIFMTATCEFSRFDDYEQTSAGEFVLLNTNGGGIALFSTTRVVYSSPNYKLNREFYNYIFKKDENNKQLALGDVMRLTKNHASEDNNKRNFSLLGDPALRPPLPVNNIITDSINGKNVFNNTDTLKALTKVTIKGHIEDPQGNKINNYNGILYPTVLDKKKRITTLANDGGETMDFDIQNNILFKGKVSIINGKYSFSFVVPKDIAYNYGKGKISYYASNSEVDAKGYFRDFYIGGSSDTLDLDKNGPSINIYMNDENFVSGGLTDENPKLYAIISDSSGVNTVGNGIGHDITGILDNNTSNTIILNDYYESDIDTYQQGKIAYQFADIPEGKHDLKIKLWDVFNNSTEEYIDFIVAESVELSIKNIFNYPNPFTENTSFFFDHNRPNEDLEVLIQIFTISGKLIKTISTIINSQSFRSEPIFWSGQDDYSDNIGRGVYLYKISVRSTTGGLASKIEKLVILK